MALLSINSVAVKTPSKMTVLTSDIDGETTRNANGELIRDRIAVKRKLELEFPPMTQTEMRTLLLAVQDTFFSVTYLDPMGDPSVNGGLVTKTMYVGDRTSPIYKYGTGGSQILWEGLNMNFIEK